MTIYYTAYLILSLFWLFLWKSRVRSGNKIFAMAASAVMILLYTLRSVSVGWDTLNYVKIYTALQHIGFSETYMETGWVLLNKVFGYFTDNYRFLWFFLAIAMTVPFMRLAYRLSDHLFLSFSMFFLMGTFFSGMNQERQLMAGSVCLLAFELLLDKKYGRSALMAAVALLFHNSAIVFVLYFLTVVVIDKFKREMVRKLVALFSVLTLIVYINYETIESFLRRFFYSKFFVDSRLRETHLHQGNIKMMLPYLLIFIVCLYGFLIERKRQGKKKLQAAGPDVRETQLLFIGGLFLCAILIFSIKLSLIQRFAEYFYPLMFLLLPNMIKHYSTKNQAILKPFLYAGIFIFSYIFLFLSENGGGHAGVIPYRFYWESF